MARRLLWLLTILACLVSAQASAQSEFRTPRGDTAPGAVTMCLNAQNDAVPCGPSTSGSTQSNYALESGGNLAALLSRTPPLNAAGQSPVSDPNNLAYSGPGPSFSVGSTVAPGRAFLADCSQPGKLTLQLSGSASNLVPYQVTATTQVMPLAVTQVVSAGGATCTYQNLYQ